MMEKSFLTKKKGTQVLRALFLVGVVSILSGCLYTVLPVL